MNFKVSEDASFGAYVSYTADVLKEFGAFYLNKFQGLDLLTSVMYGSHQDYRSDRSLQLNFDAQSLIAQTKLSKTFATGALSFTPYVNIGMSQLINDKSRLTIEGENMDMQFDCSALYSGVGLDIASKFKIDTVSFTAFARFDLTSEFGERKIMVEGSKLTAPSSSSSLMLGVKAEIDDNSSLYGTARFADQGNQFAFGINVKL